MSGIVTDVGSLVSLPMSIRCHVNDKNEFDYKAILKSKGIIFLDLKTNCDQCERCEFVELPPEWKIVHAEDQHVLILRDQKNRCRASINKFPNAHWMDIFTKFDLMISTKESDGKYFAEAKVLEAGEVVYEIEPLHSPRCCYLEKYELGQRAKQKAIDWLDENYPDWKNPGAYWD